MKPFTFALMLLAQRVDDALRLERLKSRPDFDVLERLRQRRTLLGKRMRRSMTIPLAAR